MSTMTMERLVDRMAEDDALASMRFLTVSEEDRSKAMNRAVEIINARHAIKPVTAEDIHIHAATMSTDALDSYWSRMHGTSLINFAADANEGRSFLHSHVTRNLPLGHTFEGEYVDNGTTREANAGIYMLRGSTLSGTSTDEMSRAIYAGTVRDTSVGFSGGKSVCDVCGNDLRDYENCPHIPGTKYKTPSGVTATYSIHNARLRELSGVYEGATPGSMFSRGALDKTERAIVQKLIGTREVGYLEDHYRMLLTTDRTFISVPEKPRGEPTTERNSDMKTKPFIDALIVRSGAHLPEEVLRALETARASATDDQTDLAPILVHIERAITLGYEATETLAQFRAAGVPDLTTAQKLARDGKDGQTYRADLIKDALETGVKAQGDGFALETYRKMFAEEGRSIDDIKSLRDTWEKQYRANVSGFDDDGNPTGRGGRQTQPLHGFEDFQRAQGDAKPVGSPANFRTRR